MTPVRVASLILLAVPVSSLPAQVPLYDDLGSHHLAVTTRVPRAQQYFDQGLRLTWGFNHAEAVAAFREAARLDPECAMCLWGEAYALGPNINAAMDSAAGVAAYQAVQRAVSLASKGTPVEQVLIRALARRYAERPPADRAALDSAFAGAMGEVVRQFPDHQEAATIYADALMNLSPWNYWEMDGTPRPDAGTIVAQLERVVAANPRHPGACHLYIHAVEAAHPEKAVPCAERLAGLMPGAGHIVHMPGHIYVRVGRYADAVAANEHAIHTDETYIADRRPEGVYPLAYYPHNYHFLAFAANMAGNSRAAIAAARAVVPKVPVDVAREVSFAEGIPAYAHLTLVTFGRWDDALAQPMPPADLIVATGLATYARGVAHAARRNSAGAAADLENVRRAAAALLEARGPQWPNVRTLDIAVHALAGEIALRARRFDEAIGYFRAGIAIEDGMTYEEPPLWYYPLRHSLGVALLGAGRAAEAEAAYREDLKRFPENGWSLFGLARALRAQGKTADAAAVDARFRRAWAGADVRLQGSRF
jgi:tetratricopeptide (TPR) repeat protein